MGFQDIKCKGQIFLVILGHFLPFYPPNNPKNQNFEKIKKTPRYIIILHLRTTNDNHMIYGSWDIKCDRQNFPFTPSLAIQKTKISKKFQKKKKKTTPGDIIIVHKCTKNHDYVLHNCCFSFWAIFFPFCPPNSSKNDNFKKM